MELGDTVRIKANPSKIGTLTNETSGPKHRLRYLVDFADWQEYESHN